MNITWLQIGNSDPNYGTQWREAYQNWIGEVADRQQYSALPTSVIYGCPICGWVEEIDDHVPLTCANGHRNPYFARFGEHERQVVEAAVTAWQAKWQKANPPA